MCTWSFQLFAGHKSSYYFEPEKTKIPLEDIPSVPKLKVSNVLTEEDNIRMKTLCKEYKALPQSSTRSFTSKFKAGTLPLQAYETLENSGNEESTEVEKSGNEESTEEEDNVLGTEYIDENPEYESSNNEEDEQEDSSFESNDEGCYQNVNQNTVTRSGRTVCASKKFMFE